MIIDLTPVRKGHGPARLLDMVEGRSKEVFSIWLKGQTPLFRNGIEVVAMDGFTGFKTAGTELLTDRQRARLDAVFADPRHVEVQT